MKQVRTLAVPLLLLAALAILALSPAAIPCTIELPGRIVPRREWVLARGADGQLVSSLHDHLLGTVDACALVEFERGDRVDFQRHPQLYTGAMLAVGDTVGRIHSRELERQWVRLRGELAVELAALTADSAGAQPALLREAQLELEQARQQADYQGRQVERVRALLQREAMSIADLEETENALRLSEIGIDIAAARLENRQSGVRSEELAWRRTRIRALREELNLLRARMEAEQLITPLSGRVLTTSSGDTLAVVQDTAYVVLLPARWADRNYLTEEQPIAIRAEGVDAPLSGTIERVERALFTANGISFFAVRASVEQGEDLLAPGLPVRGLVNAPPMTLWNFLKRELAL